MRPLTRQMSALHRAAAFAAATRRPLSGPGHRVSAARRDHREKRKKWKQNEQREESKTKPAKDSTRRAGKRVGKGVARAR